MGRNHIEGSEIFIFRDNTTAENAFWKGTSTSKKLFELILELTQLELKHQLAIHVVHVSGRRIIQQGTDGLLRGDHYQGAMADQPFERFIPLHLTALERSKKLKGWLTEYLRDLNPKFLEPDEWFEDSHDFGNFVWSPPPAAGDAIVEQLAKARLKRPEALHVVVIPRLMTGCWRRHMRRGSDYVFELTQGPWDIEEFYEPLLIFLCFPYRSHDPKHQEKRRLLDQYGWALHQGMREISPSHRGHMLRKLLVAARNLSPV